MGARAEGTAAPAGEQGPHRGSQALRLGGSGRLQGLGGPGTQWKDKDGLGLPAEVMSQKGHQPRGTWEAERS